MYQKIEDMAYTDFIAVIDLGTAHLEGVVGMKTASGALTVIAQETEDSGTSIRRGCVFNIEETAAKIKKLVRKLENKLNGARIAKVYVGIGGQSLHSIEHSVVRKLEDDEVVTDEIIDLLFEECRMFKPELLDVLDIVSPSYYVDDRLEPNPVGVPCKQIEARYKLIVGRPSVRRHLEISAERAQIKLAGILISPLALADVVLSDNEKKLGCGLINFGAGVTSLSVYKGGKLQSLCVIPLGGHLITKDLGKLHLVESEAERIKITYGNVISDKEDETTIQVNAVDGIGMREVRLSEVNYVIESRMKEILENVFAQLEANDLVKSLGAGIVITGGASCLRNLAEVIQKRLKLETRYASLRKGLVENSLDAVNTDNAVAVGLLMQGSENCALVTVAPKEPTSLFGDDAVKIAPEENQSGSSKKEKEEQPVRKKRKFSDLFNKGIDKIGTLFDEDDMR